MSPTKSPSPLVRWMIRRDMPEVLGIERAAFESPWSMEDFVRVLRQPRAIGMVAERGQAVVGYMIYEMGLRKINLMNLSVDPLFWRQGIGRALLARIAGKLSRERRHRAVADVAEKNTEAHLWFRACGWRAIRILPHHFDDDQDAYRFEYRWPGPVSARMASAMLQGFESDP